jgi:TetR/AcrR family fatty acid metabolism transcriptional regulator
MEYIEVLAGVVDEGQKQGTFRSDLNSRVVARALFGALDGILLTWALGEADPQALRKAASHCASLFLEGLRDR